MPELPEVETIVRQLKNKVLKQRILKADIYFPKIISTHTSDEFKRAIKNQIIQDISRRGKYLIFHLTTYTLLVHLRMSGKFIIKENAIKTPHEHIHFKLLNSILAYEDVRKFGTFQLVKDPSTILNKLGIEPLSE